LNPEGRATSTATSDRAASCDDSMKSHSDEPYSASYKELVTSASSLLRIESEYDMNYDQTLDMTVVLPGDGTVVLATKVRAAPLIADHHLSIKLRCRSTSHLLT
jgi:hypothetical protein